MNPIEGFLMWIAGCFVGGLIVSLFRDARNERKEKQIAELIKENAELHFEADRESAVRKQFLKECE